MATKEEKFDHACREFLSFNEEDLKNVKKYRWRSLNKLRNVADLEEFQYMPRDSNYFALVGLYRYMRVNSKSPTDIYQMTSDEYDNLDHQQIKRQYYRQFEEEHSVSVSSRPPATTPSVIYSPTTKLVDYGGLCIADI